MGGRTAKIQMRRLGGVNLVSAAGELDLWKGRELSVALRKVVGEEEGPLVVDLTKAEGIGATALAALLNALRRLTRQRRRVSLIMAPGSLRESFELAGMLKTFNVHPTLEAALADLEHGARRQ